MHNNKLCKPYSLGFKGDSSTRVTGPAQPKTSQHTAPSMSMTGSVKGSNGHRLTGKPQKGRYPRLTVPKLSRVRRASGPRV